MASKEAAKEQTIAPVFVQLSHCSNCDDSVQGLTVFDLLSVRFDADQMSQVLQVEEQEMIPKVKEGQTLRINSTIGQTASG